MTPMEFLSEMAMHYNVARNGVQEEYLSLCTQSGNDHLTSIIEADAGSGKTIGYLIDGMMRSQKCGLPVVIATSTRTNRDQIIEDVNRIVAFAAAIEHPLAEMPTFIFRSLRDYASIDRVEHLLDRLKQTKDTPSYVVNELQEIANKINDRQLLLDELLNEDIVVGKRIVVARNDITMHLSSRLPKELEEERKVQLDAALAKPSIILTTHAMLANSRKMRSAIKSGSVARVVIDEVDRLTGLDYLNYVSLAISDVDALLSLLREREFPTKEAETALASLLDHLASVRPKHKDFSMLTHKHLGPDKAIAIFDDALNALSFELGKLGIYYDKHPFDGGSLEDEMSDRKIAYAIDEVIGSIENLIDSHQPPYESDRFRKMRDMDSAIYAQWLENDIELRGVSVSPGRAMAWLFAAPIAVLATTAMLGTDHSSFAAQIGLRRSQIHPLSKAIRARKFGSAIYTYLRNLPPVITKEGAINPDHWKAVAKKIRERFEPGRRLLVLTPGYHDIEMIVDQLTGLNLPLLVHHRGNTINRLREQFVEAAGGAILLTVYWEGYNLVSQEPRADGRRGVVDSTIISRLPFSPPKPLHEDLLQYLYGREAAGWMHRRNVAEVTRRLYQASMRGIRGPHDTCEIIFCDDRIPVPEVVLDEICPAWRNHPGYGSICQAIPGRFRNDARCFRVEDA